MAEKSRHKSHREKLFSGGMRAVGIVKLTGNGCVSGGIFKTITLKKGAG